MQKNLEKQDIFRIFISVKIKDIKLSNNKKLKSNGKQKNQSKSIKQ